MTRESKVGHEGRMGRVRQGLYRFMPDTIKYDYSVIG